MRDFKHQTTEEILNSSTAEQRIIWEQALLIAGENCAIRKLFYCGPTAGTEFLNYFSTKLYLALEFRAGHGSPSVNTPIIYFYDQTNTINFLSSNCAVFWNVTSAISNFATIDTIVKDILFSRINVGTYSYMKFIGYRIIY